jgi:hypothetical protein
MAIVQVSHRINVPVTAAPPSYFVPNATGDPVPSGAASWNIVVDSPAYASGLSADFAIEGLRGGVWVQETITKGFGLGSFINDDTKLATTINTSVVGPFPDAPTMMRLRMDRIPAGVLASITINRLT